MASTKSMQTKHSKITALWIITVLVLFVISIVLGIIMRLNQGAVIKLSPSTFYTDMTVHGLTMISIWFVAGMAALQFLMNRYVNTSLSVNKASWFITVIGVLLLWASTFIGKFHAGWTFLHPLPFKIAWATWATPVFLASLTVLGLGWFIWCVSLIHSLLQKYSFAEAFAWQHLTKNPTKETPPFILISMISLIGILTSLIAAVILIILLFAEYYSGGTFTNDALLTKNLTYFFGHTIANEMLYLGLAVVYELFSEISNKPKWKTTWYVALGWNFTLFFILAAFLHHMYMDFVQPQGFQVLGQLASYFSSLPAAGVTVLSVLIAVYKTNIKWKLENLLFFIGIAGWIVGGVGAVIDATISNNFILHNTLWVPAHFHTYIALGSLLMSLGFFIWFTKQYSTISTPFPLTKLKITLLLVGGIGFLLAFYFAGAESIPRRYSDYPSEFGNAKMWANMGAAFASIYLIAILIFFYNITKRCLNILSSS